ncbi:PHB depolymerase family esterase [Actinoplanes sp. NBRC 101535]|uniref:extracellular catalytic domain type 1 short-chain-length polyhydroxyalkanoate depolymerase n=1 Tax=Actinoplanes sp. NBRC 101535 TaxID=3032196 RepID=UPI0024A5F728|nr:PHB depolymerase family esterase [Actinoplanes sp. NBRC 101535]GLY07570.1 hypothetical protein Acsp01_79490 [Actinoplanes sp. NBRC 101535]
MPTPVASRALALLMSATLLVSGCSAPTDPTPDPSQPQPPTAWQIPVGSTAHELRVGDLDRTYRTYRPKNLSETRPAPLVLVLHGGAGSGRQAENSYGWDAQADTGGFLVAYPDGVGRSWNVGPGCCGPAARDDVDDVAFVKSVIAAVSQGAPLDPARVYVTGISNGGMLAYRLACDTTLFAAAAPVSGTLIGDCPRPAPLSILHIHGTADRSVPFDGSPGKRHNGGTGRIPLNLDGPAVPDLIASWRATDNCPAPTSTASTPPPAKGGDTGEESAKEVVTRLTADCPGGRTVELITIAGAGHQWPGAPGPSQAAIDLLDLDPPSTALAATPTIWQFFANH